MAATQIEFYGHYSRARSIKTRIETVFPASSFLSRSLIREQDPLKQGLKQNEDSTVDAAKDIREQDPLKQGLKHAYLLHFFSRS